MPPFATDTDLLHWEPNLFIDGSAAAQTLLGGTGTLAGALFTIDSGSLHAAQIAPDQVIVFALPIDGCFPILKVESDTELTVSVLYDQLDPDSEQTPAPVSPGEASGLDFHIRTFWPQRQAVSDQILQAAGIGPEDTGTILNPQVLRRPCVLGTLEMVFTALATSSDEPDYVLNRAQLYGRLYRRALRNAMIEIDTDADGIADERRALSVVRLQRG